MKPSSNFRNRQRWAIRQQEMGRQANMKRMEEEQRRADPRDEPEDAMDTCLDPNGPWGAP